MKFDNCKVFNIEGALRGMRNPKNSWMTSDSCFGFRNLNIDGSELRMIAEDWANDDGYELEDDNFEKHVIERENWLTENGYLYLNPIQGLAEIAYIGPRDMRLATQLIKAGPEHRKFLRQIFVTIDITAPLYWWKEFDTYKVATVANSTSTMHKLASKPITLDCFEIDDYEFNLIYHTDDSGDSNPVDWSVKDYIEDHIYFLEKLRQKYLETNDKRYWKELVRWLPEGWLQTRTWTGNYETLRSMYHQRKNHKLTEWHQFCDFIETLPYAKEFIVN